MTTVGDNPIKDRRGDSLGRAAIASGFASQIMDLDVSEGVVVGVLGEWGSGKTSFINLARAELTASGIEILDFNPWMFSGAEALVESFFVETAAQLRMRPGLADVGRDLEDYGEAFAGLAWVPLVGPWVERGRAATKVFAKLLQRRREGTGGRRERLRGALAGLPRPIVVVLDDIDRLSSAEIRDVFKLVRLTASFPNLIYVVAFDRRRVEEALAEQGVPGRAYLEKILQLAVDLPAVPEQVLTSQIVGAIVAATADIENPGDFDQDAWPDVFAEVIRPLIRNMRDVRRYAAAVRGTVRALDGQIALVDVLAMEAVRVFSPDAFAQIIESVEALTTPSARGFGGERDSADLRRGIEALLDAADGHEEAIRALVQRLLPAAQRFVGGSHYGPTWQSDWLQKRRIAHEYVLRLYLERVAGEGLQAFTEAEHAWGLIADRSSFDAYLRSLDSDRLQDVIAALETYEDSFGPSHVVPGTIVLMNLLPGLKERPAASLFALDARSVVGRVVFRLLRATGDHEHVASAVRAILPELNSLYGRWEVITDTGYRENAGHELVRKDDAASFEREWRAEVRAASPADLAGEKDLLRTLYFAKHEADSGEPFFMVPDEPEVTLALLRSARTETRRQGMGTRAVHREPRLVWDTLVEVCGDVGELITRVGTLASSDLESDPELLELAQRYADGWRPRDFR